MDDKVSPSRVLVGSSSSASCGGPSSRPDGPGRSRGAHDPMGLPLSRCGERHFEGWYAWAIRSRLAPIKHLARMPRSHWPNIQTVLPPRITNAGAESMKSKIQNLKLLARGFRTRERFKMVILFHLGGLDLYPVPLIARP